MTNIPPQISLARPEATKRGRCNIKFGFFVGKLKVHTKHAVNTYYVEGVRLPSNHLITLTLCLLRGEVKF